LVESKERNMAVGEDWGHDRAEIEFGRRE